MVGGGRIHIERSANGRWLGQTRCGRSIQPTRRHGALTVGPKEMATCARCKADAERDGK